MDDHSPQDGAADAAAATLTNGPAATATGKAADKAAKAHARAERRAVALDHKTAKSASKLRRAEAKADAKAAKAGTKASEAAAKAATAEAAKAATRPARLVDRLTDPKTAKRALSVGKVLAPALAPYAIKAAVSARGFLDQRRAHRLGVTAEEVAQFRGPTGSTGARISGLVRSVQDLASRKGNELQVTRFAEVSQQRLTDLTAAVQASGSMPRPRRRRVLRSVNRELDQISADLMTHLVGTSAV